MQNNLPWSGFDTTRLPNRLSRMEIIPASIRNPLAQKLRHLTRMVFHLTSMVFELFWMDIALARCSNNLTRFCNVSFRMSNNLSRFSNMSFQMGSRFIPSQQASISRQHGFDITKSPF
jgi:hypothetical protein